MRAICFGMMIGVLVNAALICRGEAPAQPAKAPVVRRWTDITGRFHTDGILLGSDQSQVRLKKVQGSVITIALNRLSAPDQRFVLESTNSTKAVPAKASDDWLDKLASGLSPGTAPATGDNSDAGSFGRLMFQSAPPMPENIIYVRLSRQFLQRMTLREISRTEAVRDNILDSDVTGVSRTVGSTDLELQPSDRSGLSEIHFTGTTTFNTVADAGRIQVLVSGITRFSSAKAFRFDSEGIHAGSAVTNAITSSTINGIQTSMRGLRGRIATRIGGRCAAEDLGEAEAITAQHTEWKINREFDKSAIEDIAKISKKVGAQIAMLPADDPLRQCTWRARTTKDALQIALLVPPVRKDRLIPPPSPILADAEVEVQVHVALVQRCMIDAHLQKLLQPLTAMSNSGSLPARMPAGKPVMRWSNDHTWLSLCWLSARPAEPTRPRNDSTLASRK